jgi:nicotinate-nucleotide adenylyltransferase
VKELFQLDRVWLMPVYHHPFFKNLSSIEHRVAMAKLIENESVFMSDFEIKQNKESYTIDTLRLLEREYPDDTFYWILGSDQLRNFRKYKDWEELMQKHHLIIFPREIVLEHFEDIVKDALQIKKIPENIKLLQSGDLILTNASSSLVKRRLAKKESVEYIVPSTIQRYITKHNLYQS